LELGLEVTCSIEQVAYPQDTKALDVGVNMTIIA